MFPHHASTIERTIAYFRQQPTVLALILGGSVAHGFATEASDVDILIVISDQEYQERRATNAVQFFSTELPTYPHSYVDGKYLSQSFLDLVEQRGSEPARFAFADAQVLFSTIDGLGNQLQRIASYPASQRLDRIQRFTAQLNAWHWYAGEAARHQNSYLMSVSCQKLALFGARMLLAHNNELFPYHKWLPAVLRRAKDKPEGIIELMHAMGQAPSIEYAQRWYELITTFREWEQSPISWPNIFMRDSELTWIERESPIDDL